ncbi:hypothetical protein K9L16_00460 [Candidatus Pacearchaeota archaeon]|nr:hypothetical protein [Candidatus Pacearchaeota archaeon]
MNKKGLQKETIGIVIAVLCLIVLIPFGSKAIAVFISNPDNEKSESKLTEILETINYMEENAINQEELFLFNPKKERYLMVVEKENNSQLCICPEETSDSCLSGICKEFENLEIDINSRVIRNTDIILVCEKGVYEIEIERKSPGNYLIKSNLNDCENPDEEYLYLLEGV